MGFRASGIQDKTIRALGLHGSTLGLHSARIIIFLWAPSRKSFWALGFTTKFGCSRAPKPPFETLKITTKFT